MGGGLGEEKTGTMLAAAGVGDEGNQLQPEAPGGAGDWKRWK